MDPTREETYKFLEKFVAEMAKLFPDEYFHIGGDEVDGKQWDANPKIQAFMHAHGMKNNQDLQAYFNQRLEKIVAKHHKIMVGWDEILHPDLPKNIVVQSWRGQKSLATAAQQGYRGLLSYGYYLDLMWPAARHYAVDPMSGAAADSHSRTEKPDSRRRVVPVGRVGHAGKHRFAHLAAQCCDRRAVMVSAGRHGFSSMYTRMHAVSLELESLGLTHNSARERMLHRMAGTADVAPSARTRRRGRTGEGLQPLGGHERSDRFPRAADSADRRGLSRERHGAAVQRSGADSTSRAATKIRLLQRRFAPG